MSGNSPKPAAVGFRVHSGWTALIALALEKGKPLIIARARVHLVETFTYGFRQPYHTAERLPPEKAAAFISRMKTEARRLSVSAIRKLQSDLREQGFKLTRCSLLLASGRPLPALPQILASHSLIHTADGEHFREALLHASTRCSLKSITIKERDLLASASEVLRLKPSDLTRRIIDLGRPLGPPWSQDEKFAALAAWLALAQHA